jgi:secretion/DNA translocation related CpaE-like protein
VDDAPDPSPLLIGTADEHLLDVALRWCAAVGSTPDVAADVSAIRRSWRGAAAVVLGDDLAPGVARARLPRRDHVLLLTCEREASWPDAVAVGAVDVVTDADDRRVVETLAVALDGRGEACLVSVVGGVGGAGASTLATSLALVAADRGLRSMLLDADPLGGGIELVLGAEHADGLRWGDLDHAAGTVAAGSLAEALPTHGGVSVLSWGRHGPSNVPDAIGGVLAAGLRGFDVVVADVPRHLDAAGIELVGRSVLTVVLVPEEVRGVGAARRVLARLEPHTSSLALVSVVRAGGVGREAVSESLGLPVLARLRHDRHLRQAIDHGLGPGGSRPARRVAGSVLDVLGLDARVAVP